MKRRDFLFAGAAASMIGGGAGAEEVNNAKAFSGSRFFDGDEEYLLADIIAPSAYHLSKGASAHFYKSRAVLHALLAGAVLDLEDVAPPTRWGGKIVHARRRGDKKTLQEILVGAGAARVSPQTNDHELITTLLALEKTARAKKRGLWALPDYRLVNAEDATPAIGAFHLIEGTVVEAAKSRSRFYLNFGADYKTDFTAGARNRLYRKWAANGLDMAGLEGASIRIRGFVNDINGPSIDLMHVKQLELLD